MRPCANTVAAEGGEVTGSSMFDRLAHLDRHRQLARTATRSHAALRRQYPTICSFIFPLGEYIEGRRIATIPGFEALDTSPTTCRDVLVRTRLMTDYLFFLLLGAGAGAIIAALGLGLLITYQGSGVVNFALGAMATWSAYVYAELRNGVLHVPGTWTPGPIPFRQR